MLFLLITGLIAFVVRLVIIALKAAWGLTKAALYIVCLPLIIVAAAFAGLLKLAFGLTVFGLVLSFAVPFFKGL